MEGNKMTDEIPPVRLAVKKTRVRYNSTGLACDIRWAWKTATTEELQWLGADGVWRAVPRVELPIDDSAETREKDEAENALSRAMDEGRSRAAEIRSSGAEWVKPRDDREFGMFLDVRKAMSDFGRERDGFTYYLDGKGAGEKIARFGNGVREMSASVFADSIDHDELKKEMLAVFDVVGRKG